MNRAVVLAGMRDEVGGWLRDDIESLAVRTVDTLTEAGAAMEGGGAGVLVASSRLLGQASAAELAAVTSVPIVCCLDAVDAGGAGCRLRDDVGVEALLEHPLDRRALVEHVARLLGVRVRQPAGHAEDPAALAPVAIWNEYREAVFAKVRALEEAGVALLAGSLGEEARRTAEGEARLLGDSLGTYGFPDGSRIARECEQILVGSSAVEARDVLRFTELVVRLRDDLEEGEPGEQRRTGRAGRAPTLLVIDADREFAERIVFVAAARGIRAIALDHPGQAGEQLLGLRPEIVILDVSSEESRTKLPLLELLGGVEPPIPAIVIGGNESLVDRVTAARMGARSFLKKPIAPARVLAEVERVLRGLHPQRGRVLIVGEDAGTVGVLETGIRHAGLRVETLADPLRTLETLAARVFDLLILDRDMRGVGGTVLCNVLRSDPRWQGLPILIAAEPSEEIVREVFAAGADDLIPKPIAIEGLTTRIANRLERSRLYRDMVDTDFLTGLPSRERSTEMIEKLRRLATRHDRPLGVAIIRLNDYPELAAQSGAAAADRVLEELAELLAGRFRGEDVVGRWSGERLVLAMFGMGPEDGAARIRAALDVFRRLPRHDATGRPFYATFSAGIAVHPTDGDSVQALVNAAEAALEAERPTGGTYVGASSVEAEPREVGELLDVLLVEADEALTALLTHSLEARGYRTQALRDGHEALLWLAPESSSPRARVILMDVDLPGLDGLTLLRRLHDLGVTTTSRVIILTARDSEAEVLEALRAGAYDHFSKPFSVPVLMERVGRALEA